MLYEVITQYVTQEDREQDGWQRVGGGEQRLEDRHDGFRQNHAELALQHQVQRVDGQDHHQCRDQQVEGLADLLRYLLRQLDADVALFQEAAQLGDIDADDDGGEDAGTAQIVITSYSIHYTKLYDLTIYPLNLLLQNQFGMLLPEAIMAVFKPLISAADSLPAILFAVFLAHALWFAGIHGAAIVSGIMAPFWLVNLGLNQDVV